MNNLQDATSEQAAGQTENEFENNPVVSVLDQANSETISEPSVEPTVNSLPWYLDMKYFWKNNRSGNGNHLAPQPDFIDSVITEGDRVIMTASKDFMDKKSGDAKLAECYLKTLREEIETLNAFDASGVEAAAVYRNLLKRVILARKIAGASEVSAQHRIINARLTGQDEERVTQADYFKSDIEAMKKWAFNACFYEYVANQIKDGEVIKNLGEQIKSGVSRLLYDDAIQAGNRLRQPRVADKKAVADVDMASIRLATAS